MICRDPIGFDALVAYWLAELPTEREAALEDHLFGCGDCTSRLEELAALAAGVRATVHEGRVSMVVCEPFVAAMRQAGLALREYRVESGGSVNCTIRADDDAVVSRIRAPLAGAERLDLLRMAAGGEPEARLADVPFDAAAGEVLFIPSAAWLKSMPAFTMRLRLVAVSAAGERQIGDYTFNHAPS